MLGLTFSSKLDWSSYIVSIAKTVSKKIGALICSIKFLSPEIALYFRTSFSCNSMPHSGCSALHGMNLIIKKRKETFPFCQKAYTQI